MESVKLYILQMVPSRFKSSDRTVNETYLVMNEEIFYCPNGSVYVRTRAIFNASLFVDCAVCMRDH